MQGNALTAAKWLGGLFLIGCTVMVGGMAWIFSKPDIDIEPRTPSIIKEQDTTPYTKLLRFLGRKG